MKFFKTQCQKDHGEHTKSNPAKLLTVQGHLGYGVNKEEKTSEWIAVKLVKQESKSLTHFSTTISCYIIDSILNARPFVQTQSTCKQ